MASLPQTPASLFILRLYEVLARDQCQSILAWQPDGCSFHVRNPTQLEQHILPYLECHSLPAFLGRLNQYGFQRHPSGGYCHHLFVRDKPWLLTNMNTTLPQPLTTRQPAPPQPSQPSQHQVAASSPPQPSSPSSPSQPQPQKVSPAHNNNRKASPPLTTTSSFTFEAAAAAAATDSKPLASPPSGNTAIARVMRKALPRKPRLYRPKVAPSIKSAAPLRKSCPAARPLMQPSLPTVSSCNALPSAPRSSSFRHVSSTNSFPKRFKPTRVPSAASSVAPAPSASDNNEFSTDIPGWDDVFGPNMFALEPQAAEAPTSALLNDAHNVWNKCDALQTKRSAHFQNEGPFSAAGDFMLQPFVEDHLEYGGKERDALSMDNYDMDTIFQDIHH